jgi:hypothetical protein
MILRHFLPDVRFIGIEAFEPYMYRFDLIEKYDELILTDVREMLLLPLADVTIFGDVLEHMTREDATDLIAHAKLTSRAILVSVPVVHLEQGAVGGNEFERHLYHWGFEEMHDELGAIDSFRGDTVGVFWWEREDARQS